MIKYLLGVINLFFIPLIAVCITKKIKYKNKMNFYDFIFQYSIYAVALLLITSVFSVISNYLINEKIYFYTTSFTIISLFLAIVIPFLFVNVHLTIKRIPNWIKMKREEKVKINEEEK